MISSTQKLRQRLISCGKTQMVISSETGVNQSTISRIMAGKVSPSLRTYDRISAWLDAGKNGKRGG